MLQVSNRYRTAAAVYSQQANSKSTNLTWQLSAADTHMLHKYAAAPSSLIGHAGR